MKHILKHFACLFVAVLCFGQVWADDPAAVGTTLFSENFGSYSANDVPSGTVTTATGRVVYGGANVTYACTDGDGSKPGATKIYNEATGGGTAPEILVGKYGSGGSTGGSFSITGIPSGGAKAITVSFTQNKQKLKVAVAGTGYTSAGVDAKPSAVGTVTFDITVADGADATFDLTFSVYSSNVRVDDILVTVKTAGEGSAPGKTLSSVAVSGTPTKTSYYAGDNFDPAGLTVTGTYSDASTAPITSGITWSYDPSQALALNQTSIDVIATVSEIASPKFTVSGLTVTAAVNYEKVTAEPAEWSGEYLLVYESGSNAYVYTGVDANNNYVSATISNDIIAIPDGAATLTIASMEGGYSIKLGGGTNNGKYISGTSGTNTTKFTADPVANTLSIANGSAVITAGNTIRFNSGSSTLRFRYYGATAQQPVQLYKKVEGAVKPSAGLEYATADQKKLTKLGDAFTAPTLTNPHDVTVTYASNNTDVAEVNASTGAVTIKAAGVAEITASFAGNDDYKAGSASYKIGVTTHAGTEADPYVAADAKIAIDVKETVENAHATGVVSTVVTTSLPSDGYITFNFSADGATTGQQIEAYKCLGINSAPFEAVTDVVTGATVVVTGTLKKYNSTYEFDASCHLVSYEAPAAQKESIANDQAHPYTVAQAITFAANGVTYDLDDYVYVQGVVYDVKSFSNGAMNIFIKDANAENQFELYKCAGINDGNATTPFEALTDVQVGNIVIGYGQLTVYNNVYEFKQGNYLVDHQKPVTGVELNKSTETVEVGSTVTLTATILPSNATGTIVWTVESGSDKASVADGVVTGVDAGEATVRATVQGTEIYAECTVTVTALTPALTDYYQKVTETAGITEGTYLIVYETGSLAFNGSLETLDATSNTINVTLVGDKIGVTNATAASTFYIEPSAGTIKSASNKYIGVIANSNGLKQSEDATAYSHTFSIDDDDNAVIAAAFEGSSMSLRYNTASNQARFRYYKDNGQQAIQLYKLHGEVIKQAAGLAWDPAEDITLTVGDAFTARTLLNPNNIDASEITITSSNTNLATVSEGVVSLVAEATGTTTITATFAGNATYKPAEVSYKIKVNPAHSIYVSPSLNVNFGSVAQGATIEDKVITVTLTNVDAATLTLAGNGASAFTISPAAALTASGDITISASSAAVGTFNATLTISDDASEAEAKVVNLKLIVVDPTSVETPISTSTKWVAATEISDGMQVLITGVKDEVVYAMGEQKSTNRGAYAASVDGEGVLTPGEGTMAFTLVAQGDGTYAIRTSNGKYLYAANSGANHLKTQDEVDVNAKWTITTTSAVAEGSSNRNVMQFNGSGDSKLFSCYASASQSAIQFYVPQSVEPVYTKVRDGLDIGRHYTACLEKKITAVQGATIWGLSQRNVAGTAAYLVEAELPLAAGTPFIYQATDTKFEVVYEGDAVTDTIASGALRGTLKGLSSTYLETLNNTSPVYLMYQNTLRPLGTNNTLPAHRAFVLYNELTPVQTAPQDAPGRRVRTMSLQGNVATGIEDAESAAQVVKVMIDGQLFIQRGEKLYDVTGQMVK